MLSFLSGVGGGGRGKGSGQDILKKADRILDTLTKMSIVKEIFLNKR